MLNYLTGIDIPYAPLKLSIHSPTIKEISYIGEDSFFTGVQFLTFSKNKNLSAEESQKLNNFSDFEVLMKLLQEKSVELQKRRVCVELVLTLIFPRYKILFLPNMIAFTKEGENYILNNQNFDGFKQILNEIFCLNTLFNGENINYNPANEHARILAEKFKKRRQLLSKMKNNKGEGQKITILERYISILTVGEKKDMNSFKEYTVYQLVDQFQRFLLKEQSDVYLQAKLAGAKDLNETKNWMDDVHSNEND